VKGGNKMADITLVMTFINQLGSRATVTLPSVRADLTELEVSAAMDSIVSSNIFESAGGDLIAKHSAQITERQITALEVR
jgi:hypothetical protein